MRHPFSATAVTVLWAMFLGVTALWVSSYVHAWTISWTPATDHRRFVYVHHGTLTVAEQWFDRGPRNYPWVVDVSTLGTISAARGNSFIVSEYNAGRTPWTWVSESERFWGPRSRGRPPGEGHWLFAISLGLLALILAMPLVTRAAMLRWSAVLIRAGHCRNCGYDLRRAGAMSGMRGPFGRTQGRLFGRAQGRRCRGKSAREVERASALSAPLR